MSGLSRHLVELQVAMIAGAAVCFLLGLLVPQGSALARVYHPGSLLFFVGDVVFLTLPVAAWVGFRREGWARAAEMGAVMVAPVALVAAFGELRTDHLYRLVTGMYPLMTLGMVADLLVRHASKQRERPPGVRKSV